MKTPNSTLHFNQDNVTLNKTLNTLASILLENIRQFLRKHRGVLRALSNIYDGVFF